MVWENKREPIPEAFGLEGVMLVLMLEAFLVLFVLI